MLVGTDLSSAGGVNKVIRDLAEIFSDDASLDVTVIGARGTAKPSYVFPQRIKLELFSSGKSLLGYLRVLIGLRSRRFDFAVGFWTQDNILLTLALLGCKTRTILCEHTSYFHQSAPVRFLRRLFYPLAWRVLVLNRVEKQHYSRYLNDVILMPNPVPGGQGGNPAAREKLVLGVGHLISRKGFSQLVEAFERSRLAEVGWRLTLVGHGPEREAIEALVSDRGLASVQIAPPTADIAAWYARAEIIAVTSDIEVFSLVLAEACLLGVVPVAFAADGPAYLLERHRDLLVPIGDVDALAALLRRIASFPDRRTLAEAVASSIGERTAPPQVATRWRELLSQS